MIENTTVALVDYNMGNIQSIRNALNVFTEHVEVVSEGGEIGTPDAIVVPGVGSFAEGMNNFRERDLVAPLTELSVDGDTPFLGICLGMEFLAQDSTEQGKHDGLGWIPGKIRRIDTGDDDFRTPHMGWNKLQLSDNQETVLFQNFDGGESVYFVHSYQLDPQTTDENIITATTSHGCEITAAVKSENIFGTQFHPEKSQDVGLKIIENFVNFVNNRE
jgi:glutamine amidotransferase